MSFSLCVLRQLHINFSFTSRLLNAFSFVCGMFVLSPLPCHSIPPPPSPLHVSLAPQRLPCRRLPPRARGDINVSHCPQRVLCVGVSGALREMPLTFDERTSYEDTPVCSFCSKLGDHRPPPHTQQSRCLLLQLRPGPFAARQLSHRQRCKSLYCRWSSFSKFSFSPRNPCVRMDVYEGDG